MQIKDMFAKKIDREMQGVIIVGQGEETNVSQELEEYVVTKELQKHFADFFAAYKKGINGNTAKMGVWISGFFGSGKSHFLKILSYLLDNKQVGDKHALDYFIEDEKILNSTVLEDMRLAAGIPAITRAVGVEREVDVDIFEVELLEGDKILLCSDGLSNMIDDKEIYDIISKSESLETAVDTLIETANEKGGTDNISAILINYEREV